MKINRVIIFVAVMVSLICLYSKASQAGNSSVPTNFATIQAAIDDAGTVAGDTITVEAGTHTESGINITKTVTITGVGIGSTIIDGTVVFQPKTDGITIRDLTIQNSSQGVRLEKAGGTIDNTDLINIEFLNNSSRGIEVHNATTVTNLLVDSCKFTNNNIGFRVSSSGHIDGAEFRGSKFDGNVIGIYEASDGGSSTMRDVLITGCSFDNHVSSGIYLEEIQDAVIEDNTFSNNWCDIEIFKWYQASVAVSNVVITNNTMTGTTGAVFVILNAHHTSGQTTFNGVSFTNNTCSTSDALGVYAGAHSNWKNATPSLGGLGWDTVHINCNSFTGITTAGNGVFFFDPDLYPNADDQSLGGASIDVTNNWWGTTDEMAILALMQTPDITEFTPFLSKLANCEIQQRQQVNIDIKPKHCPNRLKLKDDDDSSSDDEKADLKVAILGTQNLQVRTVDIGSIRLNGVAPAKSEIKDVTAPSALELCDCEKLPKDTYDDIVLKFHSYEIIETLGAVNNGEQKTLTLTGNLLEEFGGTAIEGKDCVLIVDNYKDDNGIHLGNDKEDNHEDKGKHKSEGKKKK
jgi:hypothetical protein